MNQRNSQGGPRSNLTIYVFLIALGTLVHKTQLTEGLSEPFGILTTIVCCALLFRPASTRLLLAYAVTTLAEAAWYAPFYFLNHMVYVAFACIGVITAIALTYAKEKQLPRDSSALEPMLFPLLRGGVYAMFALVVVAKLNRDFFDPVNGCALQHFATLVERFGVTLDLTSPVLQKMLPVVTLMTEGSIPVLLFFKRTRQLGFLVAFGFHFVMAVNGFQGFSAYALSMYVPFMAVQLHQSASSTWEYLRQRFAMESLWRLALSGIVLASVAFTLAVAADRTFLITRVGKFWYLLMAPVLYLGYVWLVVRYRQHSPMTWPTGFAVRPWQIVLIALFVVQSVAPYTGFRTEATFSMFSNLQTERGHWNHLFLPEWLRFGKFQDTLVTVTAVKNYEPLVPWERNLLPGLVRQGGFQVTMFELRRQIAAHCRAGEAPIQLTYTNGSLNVDLVDACQDPDLSRGNHWFLEKIFWFRPVGLKEECIH